MWEINVPLSLENLDNLNRHYLCKSVIFILKMEMSCMKDEVFFILLNIALVLLDLLQIFFFSRVWIQDLFLAFKTLIRNLQRLMLTFRS